jgi:hypothetical protein
MWMRKASFLHGFPGEFRLLSLEANREHMAAGSFQQVQSLLTVQLDVHRYRPRVA